MKKIILSVFAIFLGAIAVSAQNNWHLNTEKDGIKVYTSDFAGSKIKALRVEAKMDASASQLVALIMDVNSSTQWIYRTKTSRAIKQVSPSELYYYSEISMPWPVANRDFVAHLTVTQDPVTKIVVIDGPAVEGFIPVRKGVVRVTNSLGKWVITPIDANHIKVQYTLHTEPGGNLPAWMVNMFAAEGPIQVFTAMRTRLQMAAYRDAVLSYIDNGGKVYTSIASVN